MMERSDILSLLYMFEDWPAEGITGLLENVPPREYQEGILDDELASGELKALARSWLDQGAIEISPFEDKQPESHSWDISLFGEVGYPIPGEFADRKSSGIIDVNSVRAAIKFNIVGSLIVFLTDLLPLRCGHSSIRDLYIILKDPKMKGDDSPYLSKWVYRSVTKYFIIPEFGSVETFMRAVIRLKKEGEGFGGLIYDRELTFEKVKKAVPDDLELHQLANILGKLDSTKDWLDLRFIDFTFDHKEQCQTDPDRIWSSDDKFLARKLLKELFNAR